MHIGEPVIAYCVGDRRPVTVKGLKCRQSTISLGRAPTPLIHSNLNRGDPCFDQLVRIPSTE